MSLRIIYHLSFDIFHFGLVVVSCPLSVVRCQLWITARTLGI